MDADQVHWYVDEIALHAGLASHGYAMFERTVRGAETMQSRAVWYHLTSFLVHAAMVSKFLWPAPSKTKAISSQRQLRGDALRACLKVADDSPLSDRESRNNVEHADERFDRWVLQGSRQILEVVYPDREAYDFLAASRWQIRRALILDEMVFVTENSAGARVEMPLAPLAAELRRVRERCAEWIQESSPYVLIDPRRGLVNGGPK